MAKRSLLRPACLALRCRLLAPAFCLLLTAFWFLVPSRSKDGEQLIAFHARRDFNFTYIFQIMLELRQDAGAELAVRHLAAAKPDGCFHFVANLQPFTRPLHAIAVIVLVRAGTKLHFLNDDYGLFLFRLVGFFLGFVLKLAKINYSTNRRLGPRRNLDEIETLLPGGAHRVTRVHHAKLFALIANHAHLGYADSLVDSSHRRAPKIGTTATAKTCSYCCTSWVESFEFRVRSFELRNRCNSKSETIHLSARA